MHRRFRSRAPDEGRSTRPREKTALFLRAAPPRVAPLAHPEPNAAAPLRLHHGSPFRRPPQPADIPWNEVITRRDPLHEDAGRPEPSLEGRRRVPALFPARHTAT